MTDDDDDNDESPLKFVKVFEPDFEDQLWSHFNRLPDFISTTEFTPNRSSRYFNSQLIVHQGYMGCVHNVRDIKITGNTTGTKQNTGRTLDDLWAKHSNMVHPKPHRRDTSAWKAILKVIESGEKLGLKHFSPVKPLGSGDTGSVHLVELCGTGEFFAMKAMHKGVMISHNQVHRACAERDISDVLDHPFLPALYASFRTPTHVCLITDYCPGGELFMLLDRQSMKVLKEDAVR
ncbi:phototropin-1A-like [Rutidosis leptorrhynchoides]|uniref:phototropin-1A-like n=1 Tax=Rutidosis leptorrhynchoides TaxID=125765 RepID=UPI003A993C13